MKKSPYIIMLWILFGLIAIFELAPLLGLVNQRCFHESLFYQAFNTYLGPTSCLGGVLAYLLILPIKKRELISTAILGIAFELVLRHYRPAIIASLINYKPDISIFNQFLFLGAGLLTACLLAILWRTWQAYRLGNHNELNSCLEAMFLSMAMPCLLSLNASIPGQAVYDPHLYALDSLWGVQVNFIVAKFLRNHVVYSKFMEIIYYYLPIWMIASQIIVYRDNLKLKRDHIQYLIPALLFFLIAIGGKLCYHFLPAVGVELYCGQNLFPNGPWPAANMNPVPIDAPYYLYRNCMPSLHLSWILAVYYSLYRAKSIYKNTALVLVALTALSTFSVGCHYLIDLIIAIPFTMTLLAIVTPDANNKIRLIGAVFGTVTVLGWLCIFKYSITSALQNPPITLTLLVATDIVALYLAHLICSQTKKTEESQLQQPLSVESEVQQEVTAPPQS